MFFSIYSRSLVWLLTSSSLCLFVSIWIVTLSDQLIQLEQKSRLSVKDVHAMVLLSIAELVLEDFENLNRTTWNKSEVEFLEIYDIHTGTILASK